MTLNRSFIGRVIIISVLIFISVCVFAYQLYAPHEVEDVHEDIVAEEYIGPAVFTWRFEEADSLNPDGNPNTDIYLEAIYANGTEYSELIDTTPSSCNEVEDIETELATVSSTIVCYGAGVGYYFAVTEGEGTYLVQRKMFEEASPEYDPPAQEYEVIAEFPLTSATTVFENTVYTETYSARVDRVDVTFAHTDYTTYLLVTNGLVREGELNTERGFGDDPDATVYVLNWQKPEGEQIRYVRFTNEPDRIYILDSAYEPIQGSALILEE